MKRRDIIKGLTLLPFASSASELQAEASPNKNGFAFLSGVSKTPDTELAERGHKILKSIYSGNRESFDSHFYFHYL